MAEIPDGEPIPMSEFTLGERYSSEDMYRDMGVDQLRTILGSRVAFERGGVIHTETVQSVTYHSPTAAIYPWEPVWTRIIRRFTPSKWWAPPQPIRPAEPARMSLNTEPGGDPAQRALKTIGDIERMMGGFKARDV